MKEQLNRYINNELLILRSINGNISVSVGTLVRLRKNAIQLSNNTIVGDIIMQVNEFIPYESIVKVSTGQKVLTR